MVVVPKPRIISCAVVGDGMVGKTSLIKAFLGEKFNEHYVATTSDFYSGVHKTNGETYKLNILDIAGERDSDMLRTEAIQKCEVVIVCYNIADRESLNSICSFWVPEIQAMKRVKFFLVGLQSDQRYSKSTDVDTISRAEGETLRQQIDAEDFFECSALNGSDIKPLFTGIIDLTMRRRKKKINFLKRAFGR